MGAETALKRIDDAMALADQGDNCCYLAFIHRLRGEILLKRDPSNSVPAEEAFRTAIDVARQQSARSLGLQAALALAKLLPIDRPPCGSARRPRARARRLFPDAGNAGDRRGAGADGAFGVGPLRAVKPFRARSGSALFNIRGALAQARGAIGSVARGARRFGPFRLARMTEPTMPRQRGRGNPRAPRRFGSAAKYFQAVLSPTK